MGSYTCIVQKGQIADGKRAELADGLRRIGCEMLDDPPGTGDVTWLAIEEGFGFTAGRPSTSSLVVRAVPGGTTEEKREAFMTRVTEFWRRTTGCTTEEIVVTAMDAAPRP